MHWIYLIHEFHNLSWNTEINELFHDILIYWDAPVWEWLNVIDYIIYSFAFLLLISYYYPFPPVGPVLYNMELSIGGQQFHGKGRTRQAAKHDAAAKAIKYLQKEPIMQQLAEVRLHTTNMMNGLSVDSILNLD